MPSNIENNLITIKNLIRDFEKKYQRKPGSVQLLAVSKGQSIEKIMQALEAGQRCFGENYLQEALIKIAALSRLDANKSIEWHFIGSIQSNKTQKIARHFAWVHSINSSKIATRLNDQRPENSPPLNVCIEVNVSAEKNKSGAMLNEILPLAKFCLTLPKLRLRGLMAIPADNDDFEYQCGEFHKVFSAWEQLRSQGILLDTLSMGMTHDFEAAIAEGATIVRIGTALFGERHS